MVTENNIRDSIVESDNLNERVHQSRELRRSFSGIRIRRVDEIVKSCNICNDNRNFPRNEAARQR